MVEENREVRLESLIMDPGDDKCTCYWTFGEGASIRNSTARNPTVSFAGPSVSYFAFETVIRTYNVTLAVFDGDGGSADYHMTMEVAHLGLLDRLGGILGLLGISFAVVSAGVLGALIWRERLRGRGRREGHRPL